MIIKQRKGLGKYRGERMIEQLCAEYRGMSERMTKRMNERMNAWMNKGS